MKNIKYILLAITVLFMQTVFSQETSVQGNKVLTAKEENTPFNLINNVLTVSGIHTDKKNNQNISVQAYQYDVNTLDNLNQGNAKHISIDVPVPESKGDIWTLDLIEVEPSFYDHTIEINYNEPYTGELNDRKHYRGVIRGDEGTSVVAISFYEDKMMGIISQKDIGNFNITSVNGSSTHVIYNDQKLGAQQLPPCSTSNTDYNYNPLVLKGVKNDKSANGDCVEIQFTTEYDIYTGNGSNVSNVVDYVEGIFNAVATLYQNENIEIALTHLHIWAATDPYTLTGSALLDQYQDEVSSITGDLAMLLTTRMDGGVAAGGGLICNSDVDLTLAASGVDIPFTAFPGYSMTIHTVAHEFGHLLGSGHTNACLWNGNNTAIDGCWGIEGTCADPGVPSGGGTIMSYCHLETVGVNFSLGFGTQPGNVIRNTVSSASCVSPCCITNRHITIDILSGTNFDFEASNNITAENTVANGAVADYDAANQVVLEPGFVADLGSEFYAFIDGCGGTQRGNSDIIIEETSEPILLNENKGTDFSVYPNPSANGLFTIELMNFSSETQIDVLNLLGESVYTSQFSSNAKKIIDISSQAKGIYLVRITNGEYNKTQKIIFQ